MSNYGLKKKELSLVGLFGEEALKDLLKKLAAATDFSFSLIDYKGENVIESLVLNKYCECKMASGECTGCRMMAAFSAAKAAIRGQAYIYECEQGLVEAAIPIIVNDQYFGAMLAGKVRCKDKDQLPDFTEARKENRSDDTKELKKAYADIPEFSFEKIQAVSILVNDYLKNMCDKESFVILLDDYRRRDVHIKDLRSRIASLNRHISIYDQKALRANILPQLLLNMMVTVSNYAIMDDAEETEKIIEKLSSILRYYVSYDSDRIPVSQEISLIEQYINIIVERYGNRIKPYFQYQRETEQMMIPKLILLPLAEYIVNFGILTNNAKGNFFLTTSFSGERCVISMKFDHSENIQNTFGYLKESGDVLEETQFHEQLEGIRKRLEYEYGDSFILQMRQDMVTLDLPGNMRENEVNS